MRAVSKGADTSLLKMTLGVIETRQQKITRGAVLGLQDPLYSDQQTREPKTPVPRKTPLQKPTTYGISKILSHEPSARVTTKTPLKKLPLSTGDRKPSKKKSSSVGVQKLIKKKVQSVGALSLRKRA